jgi:[ribosomal protein S18]-alanine N-acetyltransferase
MPKCSKESFTNLRIRPANSGDISAMMELDHQSPAAAHWSRQQYETLFSIRDSGAPPRFTLVVEDTREMQPEAVSGAPSRILASLVAHAVDNEWELENIVVAEACRRQGVGTRLLREFVGHARAHSATAIFLEVRQSNQTARSLYHTLGFIETGSRKGYYATPPEDAILYRLSFP